MRGLIRSLADLEPKLILLSVDGPKTNRMKDVELVSQTQEMINEITWDAEIRTRFRESNLGLRKAVVDAVTWANSEYGRVIVLEDDVRVGPQLLDFLNYSLSKHETNSEIAHINGYNLVPKECLENPEHAARISIYPESYAWATWQRAWEKYDDDLTWARNASIKDIEKVCGSTVGAIRWKQNFLDADSQRIDTWAYRWLASMWEHDLLIVAPNRNIARYEGWSGGTHTRFKPKWTEPIVEQIVFSLDSLDIQTRDVAADKWQGRVVFHESAIGVLLGAVVSVVLRCINKYNQKKSFELF